MKHIVLFVSCLIIFTFSVQSQTEYRTFTQDQLGSDKTRSGKVLSQSALLKFVNELSVPVSAMFVTGNREKLELLAPLGTGYGQSGKTLQIFLPDIVHPQDTVTLEFRFINRQNPMRYFVVAWHWTDPTGAERIGPIYNNIVPISGNTYYIQPSGGNILDYLYKNIIKTKQSIMCVGIPQPKDSAKYYAWIKYTTANKKYFTHRYYADKSGEVYVPGFNRTYGQSGNNSIGITYGPKKFIGEIKNPTVIKCKNHLVGELHALKLSILANDYGVTEPKGTGVTRFGDLIYSDTVTSSNDSYHVDYTYCNNLTLRQIASRADSALTYWNLYNDHSRLNIDRCITRINEEFSYRNIQAVTFTPLVIIGSASVPYYLHENGISQSNYFSGHFSETEIEEFNLAQNYPNPFNPATTIAFELASDALVTVKVYNTLGQEVAVLSNREEFTEGVNEVEFDGSVLPSGVYFYRIVAEDLEGNGTLYTSVKKMILMK